MKAEVVVVACGMCRKVCLIHADSSTGLIIRVAGERWLGPVLAVPG